MFLLQVSEQSLDEALHQAATHNTRVTVRISAVLSVQAPDENPAPLEHISMQIERNCFLSFFFPKHVKQKIREISETPITRSVSGEFQTILSVPRPVRNCVSFYMFSEKKKSFFSGFES